CHIPESWEMAWLTTWTVGMPPWRSATVTVSPFTLIELTPLVGSLGIWISRYGAARCVAPATSAGGLRKTTALIVFAVNVAPALLVYVIGSANPLGSQKTLTASE